jgi:hypothetical protein
MLSVQVKPAIYPAPAASGQQARNPSAAFNRSYAQRVKSNVGMHCTVRMTHSIVSIRCAPAASRLLSLTATAKSK